MSVKSAGMDWSSIQHKIMLGDKQIGKIYVGDKLVYPTKGGRQMRLHVSEARFRLAYESYWIDGDYYYGWNGRTDISCALPSECSCYYDIYLYFSTPVTIIIDPYTYKTQERLDGGQYLFNMHFRETSAEFNGDAYYYEIETDDCSGLSQNYATYITGRRRFSYKKGSNVSPITDYSLTYDYLHASYRLFDGRKLFDTIFENQVKEEFFQKYNVDPSIIKRIVRGGSEVIGKAINERIRSCTDNYGTLTISPPGSGAYDRPSLHPHRNKPSVSDIRTIMQKPYGVNSNGAYVDSDQYCRYKCGYLFSSGTAVNIDENYQSGESTIVPMSEATSFISSQDSLIGYHQEHIWKRCSITFTKIR